MSDSSNYPNFSFTVEHRACDSNARLGRIVTPHGEVETPAFIFCATNAAIKGATVQQMAETDTQIMLANTYHLLVRLGEEGLKHLASTGKLQRFMGWKGPSLTDSGGYQVFAMAHGSVARDVATLTGDSLVASNGGEIKKRQKSPFSSSRLGIDEAGVRFRSFKGGGIINLTPELSITVQHQIGADLIMPFDECTSLTDGHDYTGRSMERSHRWEDRSIEQFNRLADGTQALYGIIQGGIFDDLRRASTDYVNDRPFFGLAVGGCMGDNKDQM